ncbi:MAG: amidohydrolase family protein [Henriciella sp.]|nr:amidohydrolase family protein [Henriciella sp.]
MTFFAKLAAMTLVSVSSAVLAAVAQGTVLAGADIIDVVDGKTIRGQVVAVDDGKVTYVGSERGLPNGEWTRIDLAGATLLPGLSDSHVHLTSRADMHGLRRLTVSTPRAAISGVANAEKTLMAGFTTVRNLGAPGFADIDLKRAISDGEIVGPRIIGAGQSIGITGGHCGDATRLPYEQQRETGGRADGPWEVRQKVRENKKYGAEVIKFCGTGGVLSPNTSINAQQFSLEEMKAIVDEAKLLDLKVTVHAHGPRGIQSAIEAGVDSVEHASMITDASIALAVEKGTYLSMDIYVSDYILSEGAAAGVTEESLAKERSVGRIQRERFQAAVDAGVNLAFGSDAGVYPHGQNARQFAKMVEWGMSPMQAIQASTIGNADLFGRADEIGSITVGKAADIIAVKGDPLANIRELESVDFVMKGGVVYKNELN